jgi:hypothetical protein
MRKLIFALIAAGLVTFNVSGYSAEDSTVTSKPNAKKYGRAIDGGTVTSKPNAKKYGRAIEGGTVTSKPDPSKPGRTLEQAAGNPGN